MTVNKMVKTFPSLLGERVNWKLTEFSIRIHQNGYEYLQSRTLPKKLVAKIFSVLQNQPEEQLAL